MVAAESALDEEGAQRSDPEQVFDELRAEITKLRQTLEVLPETLEENRPSPLSDYSEDLGHLVDQLTAVAGWFDAIEKHPALRLTRSSIGRPSPKRRFSERFRPLMPLGRAALVQGVCPLAIRSTIFLIAANWSLCWV
jgi:hypothetical protein